MVLRQLSSTFSNGKAVQEVHLSGNATWYAGSLEDSGTVHLNASADGASQMKLFLASMGERTETQSGAGLSARCHWSSGDGIAHEVHSGSCMRPALWFLPALSLQSSQLSPTLATVDLGLGPVGSGTEDYRHLRTQLIDDDSSGTNTSDLAQQSTTDLGLDPATMLPVVLAYSVHPDNGAQTVLAIEIRYSDYRVVDGANIPFLIQRYVNGTLQLAIVVTSAQIV